MRFHLIRTGVVGLGMMGLPLVGTRGLAQTPQDAASSNSLFLAVQPHEMATGKKNPAAGPHLLDSLQFDDSTKFAPTLYVPPRCVGARRCPLVVSLDPYEDPVVEWKIPLASQYGMLLLSFPPSWARRPGDSGDNYAHLFDYTPGASQDKAVSVIGRGLKQALRDFAVDPGKIAVLGTANQALNVGRSNLQLFSRVATIRAWPFESIPAAHPQQTKAQYFITANFDEIFARPAFRLVEALRQEGAPVKYHIALQIHEQRQEDHAWAFRWLHESWITRDSSATAASRGTIDSLPLLTPEALTQLAKFWTVLAPKPRDKVTKEDSLRLWYSSDEPVPPSRKPYLRDVILPVGKLQAQFSMTDVVALAAAYPAIADALKAAGLTAQQEEAYRAAFISAYATWMVTYGTKSPGVPSSWANADTLPPPRMVLVEATSVLGRNVEFLSNHPDELEALHEAHMWENP